MDFLVKMGPFWGCLVRGSVRPDWLVGLVQVILGSLRNNNGMGVPYFLLKASSEWSITAVGGSQTAHLTPSPKKY
ncbi:hypothetical protein ES703_20861 [subsurface metagenome]